MSVAANVVGEDADLLLALELGNCSAMHGRGLVVGNRVRELDVYP